VKSIGQAGLTGQTIWENPGGDEPMSNHDKRSRAFIARSMLLKLIHEGDYQPGDQLPSERQLADKFSVSRPTVREALRILEEEGRITRHVGLGTFVSSSLVIDAGLETLSSFTEMMAAAGYTAGTSHLDISEAVMTSDEAELFGTSPDTTQIIVERVRTLDGHSVMYSVHKFPKRLVGDVPLEHYRGSLFALLEERSGVRLSHAYSTVYATIAGDIIAEKLGCSPDSALLVLDEMTYGTENQLLAIGLSYFRGDVHRYHILRRRPSESSA
jgi:GntR family transcriptional regulator